MIFYHLTSLIYLLRETSEVTAFASSALQYYPSILLGNNADFEDWLEAVSDINLFTIFTVGSFESIHDRLDLHNDLPLLHEYSFFLCSCVSEVVLAVQGETVGTMFGYLCLNYC